jgi:hypothetical protein
MLRATLNLWSLWVWFFELEVLSAVQSCTAASVSCPFLTAHVFLSEQEQWFLTNNECMGVVCV